MVISEAMDKGHDFDQKSFVTGLLLAISSSLFIGSSFIIKKIALKRISGSGYVRASAGGFSYLRQWMWWLGLITNGRIDEQSLMSFRPLIYHIGFFSSHSEYSVSILETFNFKHKSPLDFIPTSMPTKLQVETMGVGEATNLLAYGFAPAALVTPLGALSVLVTTLLSSRFLNERLNFIGKMGCLLCVVGSIVIVIHSPKSEQIQTFAELVSKQTDTLFIIYVLTIISLSFTLKFVFIPRSGNSNIVIYLLLCSAIGSLTVVFCKAVALAIKETFTTNVNNFRNYIFWVLVIAALVCIMIQMNYLNKSLDVFNTSVVTPVYYVMFTVLVIISSGILFREWTHMLPQDILGSICGFIIVITAIFMLNSFKDVQISLKDLNMNSRRIRSTEEMRMDTNYTLGS